MDHIIARLVQDFEQGKMTRRQLIQSLTVAATAASAGSAALAAAADGKGLKATYLNHVSYQVADYARTRDFYAGLFGMKVSEDDRKRKQCRLSIGDTILLPRTSTSNTPLVDHIAFTIANWDTDMDVRVAVETELKRRGLQPRATTHGKPGFHILDPDGFAVQLGGMLQ